MESKMEIVEALAKERRVEAMLAKIARRPVTGILADLAQEVYLVLLTYDEEKICDLHRHGQINFFIARILLNQYNSSNSPFHYTYRLPRERSREVKETDLVTDGTR